MQRDELIETHLPLVAEIARRKYGKLPYRDDLISAGAIGLIQAADKFDAARGVPFKRYCYYRILGAMRDEIRGMDWVPRLVRKNREQVVRTVRLDLEKHKNIESGDDPTEEPQRNDFMRSVTQGCTCRESQVMTLYYWGGLTAQSIADELRMSTAGVFCIKARVISRLQKKLTEQECNF